MTDGRVVEREPSLLLTAEGLGKRFGGVVALSGVGFTVAPGEVVGLIGHNGAGKTTLMNILAGTLPFDSGTLIFDGRPLSGATLSNQAGRIGIRMAHQELSLAENLSIAENFLFRHRSLSGVLWRRRARKAAVETLEDIFPGEHLDPDRIVGELPITQRQMIEIACAAMPTEDAPVRLLILDEPTSSLDTTAVRRLTEWLRRARGRGIAALFITHRLQELDENSDRIIVLRDGRNVWQGRTQELTRAELVNRMGRLEEAPVKYKSAAADSGSIPKKLGDVVISAEDYTSGAVRGVTLSVRRGEIVGLGGLADHGQRDLLRAVYSASRSVAQRSRGETGEIVVTGRAAYVSGDRGREGTFAAWPTGLNISIGSLARLTRRGWLDARGEAELARRWLSDLAIKAPSISTPITALSGGSQQKAILARALAADAPAILLDDPTRGVDVMTKQDFYDRVRREAASGRGILIYSTENEELLQCDRVHVMMRGRIAAVLFGSGLTDAALVRSSFEE
jgi:ribose transport system ATP-binding protein